MLHAAHNRRMSFCAAKRAVESLVYSYAQKIITFHRVWSYLEFQVSSCNFRKSKKQKAKSKNYRTQTLIPAPESEAEACFHEAVEVARRNGRSR